MSTDPSAASNSTVSAAQHSGGPPEVESIIPETARANDPAYALGIHMIGLRGTWHRLWAIIVLSEGPDCEDLGDGVASVRQQFEHRLGRAMTTEECSTLEADAKAYAAHLARKRG